MLSSTATASTAVANDDPPDRKPGLWEVVIEGGSEPIVTQTCVDAKSEAKALANGKAMLGGMCSRFESHLSGNTYTQDTVCGIMGSVQTTHTVMTIVGDEARETTINSKYDPPKMGMGTHQTKQTSKWIGQCGPDIKPGQVRMNGKIVAGPSL